MAAAVLLVGSAREAVAQAAGTPQMWSDQPISSGAAPVSWVLIWSLVAIVVVTLVVALGVWRYSRPAAQPNVELPLMFISRPVPPMPAAPPSPAPRAVLTPTAPSALGTAEPEVVEGETIRFYRPDESVLQLLPGSLEVLEGADRGQEIRFIRTQAGAVEITFGRTEGPAFRHIQLRAATVSRTHATMRFEDDVWHICNLSHTNPVVVNGQELETSGAMRPLRDGDRIEMGEVLFRFRADES